MTFTFQEQFHLQHVTYFFFVKLVYPFLCLDPTFCGGGDLHSEVPRERRELHKSTHWSSSNNLSPNHRSDTWKCGSDFKNKVATWHGKQWPWLAGLDRHIQSLCLRTALHAPPLFVSPHLCLVFACFLMCPHTHFYFYSVDWPDFHVS